ncbi:hypothetical protein BH20ACT22_BH20ACT22_13960 [soil metagenome]
MKKFAGVAAGVLLSLTVATPAAQAHPLGNFTINRSSALVISRDRVTVLYTVDMAEIPTFQEKPRIDADGDGGLAGEELDGYAQGLGRSLIQEVTLTADGEMVPLTLGDCRASLRPGQGGLSTLRIEVTFSGELPWERTALAYEDRNFTDPERLGWKEVTARALDGQGIESSSVPSTSPSDRLRRYPQDLLSSPFDVTTAHLILAPEAAGDRGSSSASQGGGRPDALGGSFAALIERPLSPPFFFVAVLLALAFGALHALGPGHGKTVMAAYLVGAQGRVQDALLVGVAVSFMHTASVVALGLATLAASNLFAPEAVYPWLSLATGVVVLSLGGWLLASRTAPLLNAGLEWGHSHEHGHPHTHSHEHPGVYSYEHRAPHSTGPGHGDSTAHGHAHPPAHGHAHPPGPAHSVDRGHSHGPRVGGGAPVLSWRGLGAVALSGGLLPSPTALVVLLGAVALDRIAFGVVLVTAFSVGLAAALTAVGVLVLRARDFAAGRLGQRAGVLLPVLSAAAIVAVGLWLTARAILDLP